MDSLTQIVLGAAVGELAQGRKLGNRAMLWGAIAGTIPDLDVFVGKLYSDPVDELAFHRGISHSFFFAATFSILMSYLTYWIYDKGNYKKPIFKKVLTGLFTSSIVTILVASGFSAIGLTGAGLLVLTLIGYWIYNYFSLGTDDIQNIGVKGWYKLFFWCIITHPILDCFTVYGTQLFLPFSNYRVGFDNISVADPGYTVPFLVCLIIAAICSRKSKFRSLFNKLGIVLSTMYMIWTFYNKHKVNKVVEATIASENIEHARYMTSPTILNNILWTTTIETDSLFYQGQYSFFDKEKKFKLHPIAKNHHLLGNTTGDHTVETLRWFSDDYFGVMRRRDGRLQINDLRYGSFSGKAVDENDFIFRFVLERNDRGGYSLDAAAGGPPSGREKEMFSKLIKRIKGEDTSNDSTSYNNGVVVSANKLASDIGIQILKDGGNAFDAAVAVNFALAVVYPRAGNIGGGGFATIHTKSGVNTTLDFREKAPSDATRDMYLNASGDIIKDLSTRGPLASGVPGSVSGMIALHDSLGSMPIERLLQPSIELAKNGWKISDNEASRLNKYRGQFLKYNSIPTPYTKDSDWRKGDTLINLDLSATLIRLQHEGLEDFYKGKTAKLLVQDQKRRGGIISHEDLNNYRSIWRTPIVCNYDHYEVIGMQPPSSGGIALCQILAGVKQLRLDSLHHNSGAYIHKLSEIEKRVFAIRNRLMGDPDQVEIDQELILSRNFTKALYQDIDNSATNNVIDSITQHAIVKEVYETTHFSIVDHAGNAISLTTTLNGNYGSFVVVEDAGFLMNNQMDDFSSKPGSPNMYGLLGSEKNSIAPNKRMLSSMSPTIILKDGQLFMILGSPGGPTIITSVLQTFLNVVEHGMTIQEAVDAPRFHDQGYPYGILTEGQRISANVIDSLSAMGHAIRKAKYIGAVEAILIDQEGTMSGGADAGRGIDDHVSGY